MVNVDKVTYIKHDNSGVRGFDTIVYDYINIFLTQRHRNSENTSDAYERDIRQFFLETREKDIEHLSRGDLDFAYQDFSNYQSYLIDELNLSISTANRKIAAISKCFRYLHARELVDDIRFLDIERPKAIVEHHDHLTHDEILRVADFVATTGRRRTGKTKRMLILFGYETCMRQEELLSLKWDNFGQINSGKVPIRTIAKGKKVMNREVGIGLYDQLLELKEDGKEKVFNIGSATVSRMMDDIRDYLNIDHSKRKIVFHSIRKAGAQYIWEKSRDINQVSKALGHESIRTTELYIDKDENYATTGFLTDSESTDNKLFEKVSHQDLIEAINKLGIDKQIFINLKLKELNNI